MRGGHPRGSVRGLGSPLTMTPADGTPKHHGGGPFSGGPRGDRTKGRPPFRVPGRGFEPGFRSYPRGPRDGTKRFGICWWGGGPGFPGEGAEGGPRGASPIDLLAPQPRGRPPRPPKRVGAGKTKAPPPFPRGLSASAGGPIHGNSAPQRARPREQADFGGEGRAFQQRGKKGVEPSASFFARGRWGNARRGIDVRRAITEKFQSNHQFCPKGKRGKGWNYLPTAFGRHNHAAGGGQAAAVTARGFFRRFTTWWGLWTGEPARSFLGPDQKQGTIGPRASREGPGRKRT